MYLLGHDPGEFPSRNSWHLPCSKMRGGEAYLSGDNQAERIPSRIHTSPIGIEDSAELFMV